MRVSLFILFTCFTTLCSAQGGAVPVIAASPGPEGQVQGRVVSAGDGAPVAYANIFLITTARGTVADSLGRFTLPSTVLGTRVRVSAVGFESHTLTLREDRTVIVLERDSELPTVTVREGVGRQLTDVTPRRYHPAHLTRWGDRVVVAYRSNNRRHYQLRITDRFGMERAHDLNLGKITGMTSHCSNRLYLFTEGFAVSLEERSDGSLQPVERLPREDFEWLFADCRDRRGRDYLYEKKRLQGLSKTYLLAEDAADYKVLHQYLDSVTLEEYRRGYGKLAWAAQLEREAIDSLTKFDTWRRGVVAEADFDKNIRFTNRRTNPFFFADNTIKLVSFDEQELTTFSSTGRRLGSVAFSPYLDPKVKMRQRVYRDPITDRTYALGRDGTVYRLYSLDTDNGQTRHVLNLPVEQIQDLVVHNRHFYVLGRRERFGPGNALRVFRGEL